MKHILIVEDEQELREYLVNKLTKLGHKVISASNGRIALELINQPSESIDLIISDNNMPEMDGPTLLKKIRANTQLKKQPQFIFCTGGAIIDFSSEDNRQYCQFDGYLTKPFTGEEVRELVNRLFA